MARGELRLRPDRSVGDLSEDDGGSAVWDFVGEGVSRVILILLPLVFLGVGVGETKAIA